MSGTLPERVTSARLRLVLLTPDDAADMLAGRRQQRWHPDYPRQDDVDAASMVHAGGDPWGPRHIVWQQQAVGSIGFYGPPDDDVEQPEVEVGFGLVAAVRRRGLATEALGALLEETDRLGVVVRAGVEPTNTPSLRLLAGLGFTQLRGSDDEGHLVMARPVPGASRGMVAPTPPPSG